ncbi:sugar phosphate isomerase/epimerase family protein [Pseudonocardia dioxanivorans]|uniref:sugar phosphate isomerase/epimerase family protein n=1 Tax=Pseudonocardia dioxanivorans TaxID=240495 RepID=UPI00104EB415|nr:sugar phosphate isomerase/epimerase [Pseudonocardia dioxanivorans]
MTSPIPAFGDVRMSLNQRTTPHNSFFEDLEQCVRTGYQGLGLDELKLGPEVPRSRALEEFLASGLQVTFATPSVWPILPSPLDGPEAPQDPKARVDAICASIEGLAAFSPAGIVVGGGRSGDPERPAGPIEPIANGLAQIADTAAEHGMRVGFELLSKRRGAPLADVDELVAFIDEVGRKNVGLLIDVVHCAYLPDLAEALVRHADRIEHVQVNDARETERTWCDRMLPGQGIGATATVVEAVLAGGYRGWFEVEVFSDDGTFGVELPDSLWKIPHEELLVRGRETFGVVYEDVRARLGEGA